MKYNIKKDYNITLTWKQPAASKYKTTQSELKIKASEKF